MFLYFFNNSISKLKLIKRKGNKNICLLRDDNGVLRSDYNFTYEKISILLRKGKEVYSKYIKDGDYIEVTTKDGYTHILYVNIDTYYDHNFNDIIESHHIDFISKNLIPGSKNWNLRIHDDNNGVEKECSPILASSSKYVSGKCLIDNLNEYYTYLPIGLRNHIIDKYSIIPYRYHRVAYEIGNGLYHDNGMKWRNLGKLWIPYEREIFGKNKYSSGIYETWMKQYHSFKEIKDFKIKCDYKWNTSKAINWWTASAEKGSTSTFCSVLDNGKPRCYHASYSNNGCVLCFRFV